MASRLFRTSPPGSGLTIQDVLANPGRVHFVDSTSAGKGTTDGYGQSPDGPLATLAAAISVASAGDTIALMPDHAEDIIAADSCVVSKAGLNIVGIGDGRKRPTITIKTATGALLSITAADVQIRNVKFVCDLDNVVIGISLAATADGAVLEDLHLSNASNKKALVWIGLAAACNDVTIRRVRVKSAGACESAIKAVGAADSLIVEDCDLYGQWTVSAIDAGTAAGTNHRYLRNAIANEDETAGLCIKAHASTTGLAAFNGLAAAKADTQPYSGDKVWSMFNQATDNVTKGSAMVPSPVTTFA